MDKLANPVNLALERAANNAGWQIGYFLGRNPWIPLLAVVVAGAVVQIRRRRRSRQD